MIRPKWPRRATLQPWRSASSKHCPHRTIADHRAPPKGDDDGNSTRGPQWPQLRRREPSRSSWALDPQGDDVVYKSPSQGAAGTHREAKRPRPRLEQRRDPDRASFPRDGDGDRTSDRIPNSDNGRPRPPSEWPHLRRRPRKPESWSLDDANDKDDISDEALEAIMRRAAPTKKEFHGSKGADTGRRKRDIDRSALPADAGKLRKKAEGGGPQDPVVYGDPDLGGSESDTSKKMMLIRAVSGNLTASDFYRLAPESTSLSSWDSTIRKVQQQRDPETLEPNGCYQLSFTSAEAAQSYHHHLTRLQRIARHKLTSPTGLWQATVPEPHAGQAIDREDMERAVDRLTIVSPSQDNLPVQHARISLRYPWGRRLTELVEPLGYGPRPPVVLADVNPGGLDAKQLQHFITQDGWSRDLAWSVSRPVPVFTKTAKARFVIACETEWEARRFQRHWNQRGVLQEIAHKSGKLSRHVLSVSVINW